MKLLTIFISVCVLSTAGEEVYSNEHALDLKSAMPAEEYRRMGLSKLSVDELSRLSRWIVARDSNEVVLDNLIVTSLKKEVAADMSRSLDDNEILKATIKGEFKGWSGKTVFKLSNGQIWRQRLSGSWRHSADSPSVEIKKNFLGYYVMRVADKKTVGVTRIK